MTEMEWMKAVNATHRRIQDGASWSTALKEFADWIGGNYP
jgi:hypothetical protein